MKPLSRTTLSHYGVAVLSIALATGLRLLLDPLLGDAFPFATLFLAVLVAAWYGGFGPAVTATLLGAVGSVWLLLPPRPLPAAHGFEQQAGLALYVVVGLGIAALGGAMRTARWQAEDDASAARIQREELRTTLASIGDAVLVTDAGGLVVSLNPVAEALTGWVTGEATGKPLETVFVIVNERTRRTVESPVARVLQEGTVVGLANHTVLIARDGTERPIDDSAAPIRQGGQLVGVVLVFRDVTERRRAEEARRNLAAIVESSDDAIVSKDLDGTITSWNAGAERVYGYLAAEVLGKPFAVLVPPDRADEVRETARRLQRGERLDHYETVRRRKDGTLIDVSVSYSPVSADEGHLVGTAVITRDVTHLKRAEEAARTRERQLQLVTDNAPVLLVHLDTERRFKFVNKPYAARFGLDPRDIIGRTIPEILGDKAFAVLAPHVDIALSGRRVEFEADVPYQDIGTRHMRCAYEPEFDAAGRVVGYVGAILDVTESKRVEWALREVEARFAAVVNHTPACVFAKDREGRYLLANRSLAELVGRRPEEFPGRTDYDFFPPEVAEEFGRDDAAVIASGQSRTYEESFPHGGVTRTYLTVKFPLRDEAGVAYAACAVATDITDLKAAQVALRSTAERLNLALAAGRVGDWSWDAVTDVVTLSERAAEVFGIPPGPHMTWTAMQKLLHEDDREHARRQVEQAVAGRTQYDIEYRVNRADGTQVWVAALGRAHYAPTGEPLRMDGVVQDITARKEADEALREEARTTETLHRIGTTLAAELDLRKIVQTVTDEATTLTGAQFGAFFYNLLNERGEEYTLYTISGVPREAFASFPMPRNTEIFEPTFRGQGVVRLDDVTRDPRYGKNAPYHGMPPGHLPVKSYLAMPVVSRSGEVLGGLFFGHPQPGVFTERHEKLVVGIAAQTAVAIDNARLYGRLRESEGRFRLLTDALPVLISYVDADQRYRLVNRGYEVWFGHPRDQLLGRTLREVLGEAAYEAVRSDVEAALAGREVTYERLLPYRDGGAKFIRANYVPHGEGGESQGFFALISDITALKRAEADARFLADASAALAGLVDYESTLQKVARLAVPHFADWCTVDMLDEGGTLRRVAVAHVDPAKVELAQDAHRRFPPDPADPQGAAKVARTGKSEVVPEITDEMLVAKVRDGERLRIVRELGLLSYMGVPLVARGQILGVITFIAAESGRRYDAGDLAVAEDLAHRAAVAIENARLFREVREADRRKDEFLAVVGHELRNPLAPISTALEILKLPGASGQVVERTREMMERQVQHMVRLVDDLLDVSRTVRGKVELRREQVELGALVARAVETVQPLITSEGHELTVSVDDGTLRVSGDPVRLAQIVGNLLNNAARYTERGGRIWVSAGREGDRVVIRVRDTGVGIAAEALPRIWDMFVQADRRLKHARGGMGIGLTLVKSLTELHGGTVEARSEGLGKGSEFVVTLPLTGSGEREEGLHQQREPSPQAAHRRVLVVDDNVDAAESLAVLLRLGGHDTRIAYDGPAALKLAEAEPPEVAFLDIGMPGMDGYELARRFREHPDLKSVVLIALTGWGMDEDRRRTKEAGFDHHFVKPVEPEILQRLFTTRVNGM
jgi:PAS domain S-box-containing protein